MLYMVHQCVLQDFMKLHVRMETGEALTPVSVGMPIAKHQKVQIWPQKCTDGHPKTRCQTKKERYPTITIDFGRVGNIATVGCFQT